MKVWLVSLLTVMFVLCGCAGIQLAKHPQLQAEYYKTSYWGTSKVCDLNDALKVKVRPYKTYRYWPEKDWNWIKEENGNGDDVTISMVWDSDDSVALGVCFQNKKEWGDKEYCGIFFFGSLTDKITFINDFKGTGENVTSLITQGIPVDGKEYRENLADQMKNTKDLTPGEDFDVCKELDRWGFKTE